MRRKHRRGIALATVACSGALCGCAVAPPTGPSVMALPPTGKSLAVFQQDDAQCRNYASSSIGHAELGPAATQAAVGSAAIGTAVGAAAGAAIGAAAGGAGAGAAIGGATGLLGGLAVGANNAAASGYTLQQQYDIGYTQCIYQRATPCKALRLTTPATPGHTPTCMVIHGSAGMDPDFSRLMSSYSTVPIFITGIIDTAFRSGCSTCFGQPNSLQHICCFVEEPEHKARQRRGIRRPRRHR